MWPAEVREALEEGSPGRVLEALERFAEVAGSSSSRRRWADLDSEELPPASLFFAGSPGLLREVLDRGPGERVRLSDSEDSSESEDELRPVELPPTSTGDGKGKTPVETGCRKRRRKRRHRHPRRAEGFMADARRGHSPAGPTADARRRRSPDGKSPAGPTADVRRRRSPDGLASPPQPAESSRCSPSAHPARMRGPLDADGFYRVASRKFGHRSTSPRSPRSPRTDWDGLCYNCLRPGHVRARCRYTSRCYNCEGDGHIAAVCREPRRRRTLKRGRSPVSVGRWPRSDDGGSPPRVRRRRRVPAPPLGRRAASADTGSCRSVTTPPTPNSGGSVARADLANSGGSVRMAGATESAPAHPPPSTPPPPPPPPLPQPPPFRAPGRGGPLDEAPNVGSLTAVAVANGLLQEPLTVIPRCLRLQETDDTLASLALVATIAGTRPFISTSMVYQALLDRFEIRNDQVDVRVHEPEDFLVRFAVETMDKGLWGCRGGFSISCCDCFKKHPGTCAEC